MTERKWTRPYPETSPNYATSDGGLEVEVSDTDLEVGYETPLDGGGYARDTAFVPLSVLVELLRAKGWHVTEPAAPRKPCGGPTGDT